MRGIRLWMIREHLKAWWQRLWRIDGLADMDVWNVEHHLATKIVPVLRRFVEMERTPGAPICLVDDNDLANDNIDWYANIWEAILWKMVDGFEKMVLGEGMHIGWNDDYINEALELFCEFYFNLWD